MKRGRSTGTPTKAQQRRFERIKEIGCIVCRDNGFGYVPCDIHHMTIGGLHGQKRLGHDYTFGLCKWHHVGEGDGTGRGPSFAKRPKAFRAAFGNQDVLFARQNDLLFGFGMKRVSQ